MSVAEAHYQLSRGSPGNAGLQPGSGSHAGAWRSQGGKALFLVMDGAFAYVSQNNRQIHSGHHASGRWR